MKQTKKYNAIDLRLHASLRYCAHDFPWPPLRAFFLFAVLLFSSLLFAARQTSTAKNAKEWEEEGGVEGMEKSRREFEMGHKHAPSYFVAATARRRLVRSEIKKGRAAPPTLK